MEMHVLRPSRSLFAAKNCHLDIIDAVPLRMVMPLKREFDVQEEEEEEDGVKFSSEIFITTKKENDNDNERERSWTMNDHSTTEEVSAKLTLFDESWIASNWELVQESAHRYHSASVSRTKKPRSRTALEAELNQREVARRMKCYTHEEEEEERKMGISTELKLYEDPFKIKKRLTKSDLGNMCRLLLGSNLIKAHVLPYLNTDLINQIESNKGAPMTVWDQDTNSEHKLVMKRWEKWKSYVLIEKWKADFVQRRNLKQGDEIGLLWDPYNSRFNFRVLKEALEE